MSAYFSGDSGIYSTIEPIYANDIYIEEVVISPSGAGPSHHYDVVDENQLIESVKLSSSEREGSHLRLSVDRSTNTTNTKDNDSQRSFDNWSQDKIEDVDVQSIERTDVVIGLDAEDGTIYYETQIDETMLIQRAKLADDGLCKAGKFNTNVVSDEREENIEIRIETSEEIADGFKTPENSEDGDKTTDELREKLAQCYQIAKDIEDSKGHATDNRHMTPYVNEPPDRAKVNIKANVVVPRSDKADDTNDDSDEQRDPDFSRLVHEVVHQLQDCDLDEILSMFAGSGILEMTGLVPPAELMAILQKHRLISRDNLFHLQGLIIRLDDTDLFARAIQYTRHHHDIVYFYQDNEIPTKGFGKVRCFVGGRDFTRLTRDDLELVRFKLASLVFMPSHYVYIVGIEPGRKVIVTLMLMERYVQELSEMAREGLPELSLVGVDAIQIHGKTYSTTGTTAIEKYRGEGYAPFISVYKQLRDKSKRLEERDIEVRQLREEAELKQLELETMGAELEILTEKVLHESVTRHRQRDRVSISPSVRRHPRSRSLPLTGRELPNDREFSKALESAVITNPEKHNRGRYRRDTEQTINETSTVGGESKAIVLQTSKDTVTMFSETNKLMCDIEVILKQLAHANAV